MADLTRRALLGSLAAALPVTSQWARAQESAPDPDEVMARQRTEYEARRKRAVAAFPFERITVPGKDALTEWERLRAEGHGWPVVVGNEGDLGSIVDQFGMNDPALPGNVIPGPPPRSPGEIIAAAENISFPVDLRRWPGAYQVDDLQVPLGEWPSEVEAPASGLTVATDLLSGRSYDKVHILLIPTRLGWEVPAYLRWGDWNACPPPEYHVAALRHWHKQYGVDLIGINGDTMNLRAAKAPATRDKALALAREQYEYCPDIVDQGAGSISALAATLMASGWWYFWWD